MLSKHFDKALSYASELHREQTRKGTDIPYVSHLLAVAGLVIEAGGTENEAIAALLHDAVEDQGGAPILDEIRRIFGDEVAEIVDGCSDTDQEPKPPWRQRKEDYIAHLETASPSVLLVSCADKLHNARAILADYRSIGDELWGRFNGGRDGTLWYVRALVSAFRERMNGGLVDELDRVTSELEQLASEKRFA